MAERKLKPKNLVCTRRGIVNKKVEFKGEEYNVSLKVFTNREHDDFMSEFADISGAGADIEIGAIAEERLLKGLLDIDIDFDGKTWHQLNDVEKRVAINEFHPGFRDLITNEIMGATFLSQEEKNFLRMQS